MTVLTNQRLLLVDIIAEALGVDATIVKPKINEIVDKIVIELSKGNSIYHPSFITLTPALREGRMIKIPYQEKEVQIKDHIYTRVALSSIFTGALKQHGFKNLNLL